MLKTIKYTPKRRELFYLTVPCVCGIKRALPDWVWIMKAVQGVDGGNGGGAACEPDESKPLSAI